MFCEVYFDRNTKSTVEFLLSFMRNCCPASFRRKAAFPLCLHCLENYSITIVNNSLNASTVSLKLTGAKPTLLMSAALLKIHRLAKENQSKKMTLFSSSLCAFMLPPNMAGGFFFIFLGYVLVSSVKSFLGRLWGPQIFTLDFQASDSSLGREAVLDPSRPLGTSRACNTQPPTCLHQEVHPSLFGQSSSVVGAKDVLSRCRGRTHGGKRGTRCGSWGEPVGSSSGTALPTDTWAMQL